MCLLFVGPYFPSGFVAFSSLQVPTVHVMAGQVKWFPVLLMSSQALMEFSNSTDIGKCPDT